MKKLGIEFLTERENAQQSPRAGRRLDDIAVITVGRRVLDVLSGSPNKTADLYTMVDRTGVDLDTLLSVTKSLATFNLVGIVQQDPKGNHRVKLTEEGARYLAAS